MTKSTRMLLLALAGLTLAACEQAAQKQGMAPPPAEVDVVVAARASATLTQDLPGRLQAWRTAQVRARIEGIVEKRLFEEGSDVKEGAPLFHIDSRTYQTAADSARADLAVAKRTVDRYRPLLEIKAVSQQEFDLAEAKWKQAEAALARAELDLANTSVPAPIAGRVGRALVTEGALVGRGEATLLTTIEQIDPIYVNFTQSNAELLRLQQAMRAGRLKQANQSRVELLLDDGSVYPLPGKLLFSDMAVDPSTGSVALRASFPNPQRQLLPGLYANIRFNQAQAENAIMLPQRAVQMGPQGSFVMVVDANGQVAPRPVKTAGMNGGNWIINEGLQGGEQIIVNGLQKLRPGAAVKPVPWNPAPATPAAAPAKKQG